MITEYQNEYREVGTVYYDAVHFIASQFSTPAEIDAWAPLPRVFSQWKVRCEAKRPFLYKVGQRVGGFLELDADGHIGAHCSASGHPQTAAPLLDHAIAVARATGTVRALFVETDVSLLSLYRKFGFKFVEAAPISLPGHRFAAIRMCKFL